MFVVYLLGKIWYFSPKKQFTWGFCPTWPNVELIPMTVLRPLAQRGFRGASGRCEFVPDACYLEVHLGRVLNVLYWKVAWSTSSSHIPAKMFPWISLADLNHGFLKKATRRFLHRGIRKRPSKHTGRSARSRKVDPTCWRSDGWSVMDLVIRIIWNHHESATQKRLSLNFG